MSRARLELVLAGLAVALVGAALAVSEQNLEHEAAAPSQGGGVTGLDGTTLLGTIGDGIAGRAESANFILEAGFQRVLEAAPRRLWLTERPNASVPPNDPKPWILGPGGETTLHWNSDGNGTYDVYVNGVRRQGPFTIAAGAQTTVVPASDLEADRSNLVAVRTDLSGETAGLVVNLFSDQTPPALSEIDLRRVTGSLRQDLTSSPVALTASYPGFPSEAVNVNPDGSFSLNVPLREEVTLELTNRLGRSARRRIVRGGEASSSDPLDLESKSVILSPVGDVEIELLISSAEDSRPGIDAKGVVSLFGTVSLRHLDQPGAVLTFPLLERKGKAKSKLKKKPRGEKPTDRRKLILKGKSAKGTSPRIKFKLRGHVRDGVVTVDALQLTVDKEAWVTVQRGVPALSFRLGEDGGNPISVATVQVLGTVSDERAIFPSHITGNVTNTGSFGGNSPAIFVEDLDASSTFTSTITATDDASPGNAVTQTLRITVEWDVD